MNFNLLKSFIFLCFHEHKNTKLNHFNSISKRANFRVLHEPWLSSQGGVHGQNEGLVLVVAHGTAPLKWEGFG
jgi:hypothetical protein